MCRLIHLSILWACLVHPGYPQGAYSISGTVSDPSGAAIPDADVLIRQRGTTVVAAQTRTDVQGNFRAAGLPAAPYEVGVQHDGFASQTVRLAIKDRSPAPLHVELKLAGARQEVTVAESAAQVSTDSADNLDVVTMDRQTMDNLPVFDQNYVAAMSQFLDPRSIGTGGVAARASTLFRQTTTTSPVNGRAPTNDARHRLNLMGTIQAAKYLDFGAGLFINSGMPYTETTGLDQYHTGYANARPPGVPRNSLQGPGFAELDLRWSHEFALTHRKEGPRFTVSLNAFNVTNRVNYVTYVGDLSSPFFGHPVAAKPPRRLQLSGRFEF